MIVVTVDTATGPCKVVAKDMGKGLCIHREVGVTRDGWVVTMIANGRAIGFWRTEDDARLHAKLCVKMMGNWNHTLEELELSDSTLLVSEIATKAYERTLRILALLEGREIAV